MKRKKGVNIVLNIIVFALVGVALFSGYKIIDSLNEYGKNRQEYNEIREQMIVPQDQEKDDFGYLRFDYNGLMRVNPDFKCWIDIPGTIISYPVVQGPDNDYYLRRTFSGQYNVGGVIFLDYTCPDDLTGKNTVIYGHRMNDGSMFTDLKKFVDGSLAKEYNEVHLYRADGVYIYKIFSACKTDAFSNCYRSWFSDETDFGAWLDEQVARTDVFFDAVPTADDKIITLSTCVGSWDETGRYVVQAMLVDVIKQDG